MVHSPLIRYYPHMPEFYQHTMTMKKYDYTCLIPPYPHIHTAYYHYYI